MTNTMTPSELADWLDRRGALFDEEAAATIRELEAKLKIATDALDPFALLSNDVNREGVNMNDPIGKWLSIAALVYARDALARIEEVG